MRTDKDIYFPVGKFFQDTAGVFRRAGTAQVLHFTRHSFQSFAESLEVLECQYGGRHQYRHLLVVGHRLECSPHRHFGLSETHIATHQAGRSLSISAFTSWVAFNWSGVSS